MRSSVVLVLAGLAACTGPSNPIPVSGDIAALAGQWQGEYSSDQSGRTGIVYFQLKAGSDTARGEVVMYPVGQAAGVAPWEYGPPDPNRPRADVLTITFVRSVAGVVTGQLDPYRDPQCGCLLTTTFIGTQRGDTLSGTFSSWHREMQRRTEGIWKAVRVRHDVASSAPPAQR